MEIANELSILSSQSRINHTFTVYPWSNWVFGSIIELVFIVFFMFYMNFPEENKTFIYKSLLFLTFYIGILLFYISLIEKVTFNKYDKKIIYNKTGFFSTFPQKIIKYEDVFSIKMVYKGTKNQISDTRRYFIRVDYRNNDDCLRLSFGECSSFRKVSRKYQKCIALVYSRVEKEVDKCLLVDKTKEVEFE